MLIDVSSAQKIGNLTQGGGLSGAFDGNPSTIAYAEYSSGYIGVSFEAPRRISTVDVVSASNGFDASGLMTGITLSLYGKTGSAPVSGTDGSLLATTSFTDQNVTRTVALESLDKLTAFDHVWIRVVTGKWCIVSDIRLYEMVGEPVVPEPLPEGYQVLMSSCNQGVMLTHAGAELPQFRIPLYLDSPRRILLDFHGDVKHIGLAVPERDYAVGYSFRLCVRSAESTALLQSEPFVWIPNAVGGGNVRDRPQHYGNKSICSYIELPAGAHEISVIGSGHTDATTVQLLQILEEGGYGLNCLRLTVLP